MAHSELSVHEFPILAVVISHSYVRLPEGFLAGWWCNNHLEKD
jgi:hypothetical protein